MNVALRVGKCRSRALITGVAIILTLLFHPLPTTASGQDLWSVRSPGERSSSANVSRPAFGGSAGHATTSESPPDRTAVAQIAGGAPDDEVRFIVRFTRWPLSKTGKVSRGSPGIPTPSAVSGIRAEHDRFRAHLAGIVSSLPASVAAGAGARGPLIRFEYANAFNGVSMVAPAWVRERVRRLPMVTGIWEDVRVEMLSDTSNALIGAPVFWSVTGKHGEGMDIGILDTGIDYFHDALGNSAFPNAKVVGGYDVVNGDTDPLDDNGHGTHVAGIAAGNAGPAFRGVAYEARLWAFKVLDKDGFGYLSWIIEGIERALDPDDDPSTPTPIDVLNMSLGTAPWFSDPDDPASQAVDNAFDAGLITAAAAGNEGPGYQKIGSPAAARKALCVGASTLGDSVAWFSSRGPSNNLFQLKPDLVAPGAGIVSAQAGTDGYIAKSGTSMATPHVAGAVALFRQLHPEWSAEDIVGAIVESSRDLNTDVHTQGGGCLSLATAAVRLVAITPQKLHFGIDDASPGPWAPTRTIEVANHGPVPLSISLSATPGPAPGATVSFSPQNPVIPAGGSVPVTVTLNVNNSMLPFKEIDDWSADQPNYHGTIRAFSASPSLTIDVPYGFVKMRMIRLASDRRPAIVQIRDRLTNFNGLLETLGSPDQDTLNLLFPPGTVDIAGSFGDRRYIYLREAVAHTGVSSVTVTESQAVNAVAIRPTDWSGQLLRAEDGEWGYNFLDTTDYPYSLFCGGIFCASMPLPDTVFFPNVSKTFRLDLVIRAPDEDGAAHLVRLSTGNGISQSRTLSNPPEALRRVDYTVAAIDTDTLVVLPRLTDWQFAPFHLISPFTWREYHSPDPVGGFSYGRPNHIVFGKPGTIFWTTFPAYWLPQLWFGANGNIGFHRLDDPLVFLTNEAGPLPIKAGYGAPRWAGRADNLLYPGALYIHDPGGRYFPGATWLPGDETTIPYTLTVPGGDVSSGHTAYSIFFPNRAPGPYTYETAFEAYQVGDRRGRAGVRLEFDTRMPDPDPPYIERLDILSAGMPTDELFLGGANVVEFVIGDGSGVGPVSVLSRTFPDTIWREIATERSDDTIRLIDFSDLGNGPVSLRIRAADLSGNLLEYSMDPAFLYHAGPPVGVQPIAPSNGAPGQPDEVLLSWIAYPVTVAYHVQLASDSAFGSIVQEDSGLTADHIRITALAKATTYYWRIRATNPAGPGPFSTVRSFSTSADSTRRYTFRRAWNLVSLPLAVEDAAKNDLFPTAASGAFTFNGGSYQPADTLTAFRGYWLKFDGPDSIAFAGSSLPGDSMAVTAGWNLIGAPSEAVATTVLATVPPGLVISPMYGYDAGYTEASILQPGRGYWFNSGGDGMLIVGGQGPGAAPAVTASPPLTSERLNTLTVIVDGAGDRTLRYGVAPGSFREETYELPPVPPPEAVDVRFSSNRTTELVHPGTEGSFSILVNPAGAPFRIAWDDPHSGLASELDVDGVRFNLDRRGWREFPGGASAVTLHLSADVGAPSEYALRQNYPNPFNHSTTISYDLPAQSKVRFEVFNVLGQALRGLVDEVQPPGRREFRFNAAGLPPGVYFYRIRASAIGDRGRVFTEVRKMLYVP